MRDSGSIMKTNWLMLFELNTSNSSFYVDYEKKLYKVWKRYKNLDVKSEH